MTMRKIFILALGTLALTACAQGPLSRDQLVAEPTACAPQPLEIYFAESTAQLTAPARQAIDLLANKMARCDIQKVTVIGLSSATGTSEANLTLAQRRAQTVAAELERRGWPAPAFQLEAAGDAGAVTADGAAEPLRRRTLVFVEATPR